MSNFSFICNHRHTSHNPSPRLLIPTLLLGHTCIESCSQHTYIITSVLLGRLLIPPRIYTNSRASPPFAPKREPSSGCDAWRDGVGHWEFREDRCTGWRRPLPDHLRFGEKNWARAKKRTSPYPVRIEWIASWLSTSTL